MIFHVYPVLLPVYYFLSRIVQENNGNQLEKSYIYFSLYLINLHGAFVAFLDIISMVIFFIE